MCFLGKIAESGMAGDPGVGGLHSLLRLVGSDLPGTGHAAVHL